MDVEASSTCKYLTLKARKKADLRNHVCTLRLVACCKEDAQILLAIHRCYIHGGTIHIEVPKKEMELKATLRGFYNDEKPRCMEKNDETGQCELAEKHAGKHLAGYLFWDTIPERQAAPGTLRSSVRETRE